MTAFISALGLAAVIAGLVGAAVPDPLKRGLKYVDRMPAQKIRVVALACAALGLFLLWSAGG